MTKSVLEFDEVAADDALIEAIRAGAGTDDLPSDDPAAAMIVALRDGAEPLPEAEPVAPVARGMRMLVRHRRLMASGVAGCMLVVAGVSSAVAGNPAAAFSYVFRQGIDLGSRLGSPAGDANAQAPIGGGESTSFDTAPGGPPVRVGSASAPRDHEGTRAPFGFDHEPKHWNGWAPRGVGEYSDDDRSGSGRDEDTGGDLPHQSVPTWDPGLQDGDSESVGPEDTDDNSYGPQSEPPQDESGPPDTHRPTEDGPTESAPTDPTPSDSTPTEPSPTSSGPTSPPSEPTPTVPSTSAPTQTPTVPEGSPTSVPTATPDPTESVPMP